MTSNSARITGLSMLVGILVTLGTVVWRYCPHNQPPPQPVPNIEPDPTPEEKRKPRLPWRKPKPKEQLP